MKLVYTLKNIQLEYEMIRRKSLADESRSLYSVVKEFFYDHVVQDKVVTFAKGTDSMLNIKVTPQRRSLKGILLLFLESYTAGTRDAEKYFNPSLTKVRVTPIMLYNDGIEDKDTWAEVSCFFGKTKNKTSLMTLERFYADNKFGLLIHLRSMPEQLLHGSGMRLVNTTDGVELELVLNASGSGNVNCHVFVTSDAQMSKMRQELQSVVC